MIDPEVLGNLQQSLSILSLTDGHNWSGALSNLHPPDPLLALFLTGLLTAGASFLGMVRTATRRTSAGLSGGMLRIGGDVLEGYCSACSRKNRPPLLLYSYVTSLFVGLGALLFAVL